MGFRNPSPTLLCLFYLLRRGHMSTSPVRPQSPVVETHMDLERQRLLHENVGICGRFTHVFVKNLPLILLLCVTLIGLCAYFPDPLAGLMKESCKMHHDEFLGKLWLECPEALRRSFGPRRGY